MSEDRRKGVVDLGEKLLPETGNLLVVPPESFKCVGLRLGPNEELEAHPFRRMRARTSVQGEPTEGSR